MVWGAVIGMGAVQFIGMVFYSKLVLGRPWCRVTFPGRTWEQIAEAQQKTFHIEFVVCLLSQLVLVLAINYIIGPYLGVKTIELAIKIALGLTGVSLLVDIPHCVFSQRALVAFVIDHVYNALVLVTICVSFVYFG